MFDLIVPRNSLVAASATYTHSSVPERLPWLLWLPVNSGDTMVTKVTTVTIKLKFMVNSLNSPKVSSKNPCPTSTPLLS